MTELKPCPFCGSEDLTPYSFNIGSKIMDSIFCYQCEASGPRIDLKYSNSERIAADKWNTRAEAKAQRRAERERIINKLNSFKQALELKYEQLPTFETVACQEELERAHLQGMQILTSIGDVEHFILLIEQEDKA